MLKLSSVACHIAFVCWSSFCLGGLWGVAMWGLTGHLMGPNQHTLLLPPPCFQYWSSPPWNLFVSFPPESHPVWSMLMRCAVCAEPILLFLLYSSREPHSSHHFYAQCLIRWRPHGEETSRGKGFSCWRQGLFILCMKQYPWSGGYSEENQQYQMIWNAHGYLCRRGYDQE